MAKHLIAATVAMLATAGTADAGETAIVERLRKAGAIVLIDPESGKVTRVDLPPEGAACLAQLCELRDLQALAWHEMEGAETELKAVGELKGLMFLDLIGGPVTDGGLKELRELRRLEWLLLSRTKVTDAGLKELAPLKSLQVLYLAHTEVTDAGLTHLADLPSLRTLNLGGCRRVTDASLPALARLKGLKELSLNNTGVTEEGAERLRKQLPGCFIVSR